MPSGVSRGLLVHRKTAALSFLLVLLVLVIIKDVNVVMTVVMAVVVIAVPEDIDRSVPLKIRAVWLFCQVDHWDMLVLLVRTQVQIQVQACFHEVLALVVVAVVIAALLPRLPGLPLLSSWGVCSRSWALEQHLDELVVLIHAHAVAVAQVLLTWPGGILCCGCPPCWSLWLPIASPWTSGSTLPGRPCSPASPPQA